MITILALMSSLSFAMQDSGTIDISDLPDEIRMELENNTVVIEPIKKYEDDPEAMPEEAKKAD